jgi:threonine/homoserine/homoserine lactone efflux protein
MAGLIGFLASAFAVGLTGALSPGPLTTFAITEGARRGRWSGSWLSAGHGLAEGTLVIAIGLGLGSFLKQPVVGSIIGVAGGLFLLWMGWGLVGGAWRGQLSLQAAPAAEPPFITRTGMILTALQWGTLGLVVFYAVHWLTDLFWLSAMSFLTASGRGLMNDRVYRIVLAACGLFFIAFSVYFVSSGLDLISQIH